MKKKELKEKMKQLKSKSKENTLVIKLEKDASEIKSIKKANKSPKGQRQIENTKGNIMDVKNINKFYVSGKNSYHVLKDVSLNIKKGEFVVIVGPSGSGKTTLLNIISGLDRATDGNVICKNINLSALKNSELTTFRRNHVGFVFQSYNLLSELNAEDNAQMGRQLQTSNNRRMDISDLFERVGIGGLEKKTVGELSGGQMQRVSIVRALSKNPDIIFADEPTGALDSKSSEMVLDLFKEINKKYKTTIVLVTHDMNITKLADRVIEVSDGEVKIQTRSR